MGCILTVLSGGGDIDCPKWGVCIRWTAGRDREVEGGDAVFGVRGHLTSFNDFCPEAKARI